MFVEIALQVVVSGLLAGVEYAVAAVGMTMIFSVGRVLNLAHGSFFALGAYIAYQSTLLGIPSVGGAAPAAIAGLVIGAAVERVLVRRDLATQEEMQPRKNKEVRAASGPKRAASCDWPRR